MKIKCFLISTGLCSDLTGIIWRVTSVHVYNTVAIILENLVNDSTDIE